MDQQICSTPKPHGTAQLMLALGLLVIGISNADAQELDSPETVASRSRPELDPKGLPIGGFTLRPSMGLAVRYDDNIFADKDNEVGDRSSVVTPEIRLNSNWSRHRLNFLADAAIARYRDNYTEEYDDYRLRSDGRLDLRNSRVDGALWRDKLHEDRTSPDDDRGTELNRFTVTGASGGYTYMPGRFLFRGEFELRKLNYSDTETLQGPESNNDRDRKNHEFGFRAGYKLSPDYIIFAETRVDKIEYDQKVDDDGYERSSDGYEIVGGTQLDLSGRTFGEIYAGYLDRDYDDPRFNKANGLTFGAALTWNVTGLTTLIFNGSRTVDSTTIEGASGIEATNLGVHADHELFRNLILNAGLEFVNEDYDGINRTDDVWLAEFGGEYKMNRYVGFEFGYRYQDRDTSPDSSGGRTYQIQDVFVRVVGHL